MSILTNSINANATTPLPLLGGGTNSSLTASNGGIVYSTATAMAILSGTATAGLALFSGASTTPSWSASPPFTRVIQQIFTASGTYTPTSGMKYCYVQVVSGGGGGGGGAATAGGLGMASGGGGGGYGASWFTAATIGASQTATVGAAGAAGASGTNTGGTGGASSLGTLVVTAGGTGATGASNVTTSGINSTPGTGGAVTTAQFAIVGAYGDYGFVINGATAVGLNGNGGSSGLGLGTFATGSGYGAGGAGAFASGANAAGIAGTQGIIIVTEYVSI